MSKYPEPWSQGKFLLSDVNVETPSKDVIKNIDEMQSKQIYVHFATDKQRRIAITNDARIAGRIALCVNACEGITNEALEAGIVLRTVGLFGEESHWKPGVEYDWKTENLVVDGINVWEATDGK